MASMKPAISSKVSRFFGEYPVRRYSKGDIIVFADSTVPPVFFIVKGKIGQYDIAESGNKAMLNIFHPPAFFPMMNALTGTPNRHFYEALTDVQVRVAPHEEVVGFLSDNNDVTLDLLARVYSGIDGLLGKMTHLMAGTARSRILQELTVAATRFGDEQPSGARIIQMTEAQLANQTGLARETVSRELQKLKKDGLISMSKGTIVVEPSLIDSVPA